MKNYKTPIAKRELISKRKDIGMHHRFKGDDNAAVVLRFDDRCGNGHNTFSITIDGKHYGGCMYDEIREHFPEYAHLIKWHLCSTDGPLHYLANTIYWAKNGKLDYARKSAIAPDATLEQLADKEWLIARLPALMRDFQEAMHSINWIY